MKFLIVVSSILYILSVGFKLGYSGSFDASIQKKTKLNSEKTIKNSSQVQKNKSVKETENIVSNKVKDKTVAIMGLDKGAMRTDVIFIVNFNAESKMINLLSIPRDTKVVWDETMQERVLAYKKAPLGSSWTSKINEIPVYAYAKNRSISENIKDFSLYQIEKMTGLTIDNYAVIDIEAFREIVDAIGGVEVNVPRKMYYKDNSQGLYIDLEPGLQTLDGNKAEQLVRFRKGYATGDVGRIETQQLFLKAFAEKLMSPSVIKDIPEILSIALNYIQTDVSALDVLNYLPVIKDIDLENQVIFNIMPGDGHYESGKSYFFPDYDALNILIQQIKEEQQP